MTTAVDGRATAPERRAGGEQADMDRLVDAAAREARGRSSAADRALLRGDLDGWAAALQRLIDSTSQQHEHRRELIAHKRDIGDLDEARQLTQQLDAWLPKALRFQSGCRTRKAAIDRMRIRTVHQRLRRVVAHFHDNPGLPYPDDDITDLLDELDRIDPLEEAS